MAGSNRRQPIFNRPCSSSSLIAPTTFAALMSPAPILRAAVKIAAPILSGPTPTVKIASVVKSATAIKITSVKFPRFIEPASTIKIMLAEFSKSSVVEPRIAEDEPVAIIEAMRIPHAAEVIRPVIHRTRVVEVVPGPGANEHAIHKPLRPVISIRRAAERIRRIKPPLANRWRMVHAVIRAKVDPYSN